MQSVSVAEAVITPLSAAQVVNARPAPLESQDGISQSAKLLNNTRIAASLRLLIWLVCGCIRGEAQC
jgi:hypothetical protein